MEDLDERNEEDLLVPANRDLVDVLEERTAKLEVKQATIQANHRKSRFALMENVEEKGQALTVGTECSAHRGWR
jgi:hypothetical protein